MSSITRKDYPRITRPAPMKAPNSTGVATRSMTRQPNLTQSQALSMQAHQQKGPITRSMAREQIITTEPAKQGLFDAFTAGDLHAADVLLQRNPGLANKKFYDSELKMNVRLSHIPVHLNDVRMVKLVFGKHHADPQKVDGDGSTAIDHASYDTLPFLERR